MKNNKKVALNIISNFDGLTKQCRICEITKNKTEYAKSSEALDGCQSRCRQCQKEYAAKWYLTNGADQYKKQKIRDKKNPEVRKNWVNNNKESVSLKSQSYYQKNKEVIKARSRRRTQEKKPEINAYRRERRKRDPLYKLAALVRSRLANVLKRNQWTKTTPLKEYLGCDLEQLKTHLQNKFKDGMNWQNHTTDGWHIDHIIPLVSAKTEEAIYKLCHFSNLQPLWSDINSTKGGKLFFIINS